MAVRCNEQNKRSRAVAATYRFGRPFAALLAALACLAACAAHSPIAEQAAAGTQDIRPLEALEHPETAGARVIWGGQIVEVVNQAHETEIHILSFPLDGRYRPLSDQKPGIRFVAVHNGFLDPALFSAGRFVSLIGRIAGERVISVGSERHVAPLITAEGIELWEEGRDGGGPSRVSVSFGLGIRF